MILSLPSGESNTLENSLLFWTALRISLTLQRNHLSLTRITPPSTKETNLRIASRMFRNQISNAEPPQQLSNPVGMSSPSLLRSKSLNDISNDSQISLFASDRFIDNIHTNNTNVNAATNNNDNGISHLNVDGCPYPMPVVVPPTTSTLTACLSMESNYTYNNQSSINTAGFVQQQQRGDVANIGLNPYGNQSSNNLCNQAFDNSRNLNLNQDITSISNQQFIRPQPTISNSNNVFNICNALAINLNGVTEQIGNLHL